MCRSSSQANWYRVRWGPRGRPKTAHRCSQAIYAAAVLRLTPVALAFVFALSAACDDGDGGPDPLPDGPRPGKRSDVATLADPGTGAMVVFGGDNGPIVAQQPMPSYIGDSWLLHPSEGWIELTGTAPSARGRYAVARGGAGSMLLFGGRHRSGTSGPYTLFNDIWLFDYDARSWAQVSDGSQGGPSPRYFSTAATDNETGDLVIFGGGTNEQPVPLSSDLAVWRWDGGVWTEMATTGSGPSNRLFMAYTHDSQRNRLIVFGGQVGDFTTPSYSDLYALDLKTGAWTQLHAGGGGAPSGRFSATLSYDTDGDRYLLFGGHADLGVTNDIWFFEPNSGAWLQVAGGDSFTLGPLGCGGNPREIPKSYVTQDLDTLERRSGPATALSNGKFWVFGGESDCSDHLDDVWQLDISSGSWAELLEARTGESCARRNDDCECLCL